MSADIPSQRKAVAGRRPSFGVRIALVLGTTALAVFVLTLVHAVWYAPEAEMPAALASTESSASTVAPSSYPTRLTIPSIGVDAHVQYVGLSLKGNMGIPTNFTDVAWYKLGVVPGDVGDAVIDGHVDNALSLPGVFKHLSDIQPGSDISVVRADGSTVHFTVQSVDAYDYAAVPTEEIFHRTGGRFLTLITCTGSWVQTDKTYNERLVVTTVLSGS